MTLFPLISRMKKLWVPVGVNLTLGMSIGLHPAFASTGPSWSQPSAWNATDSGGVSKKTANPSESHSRNISPFSPGSNNLSLHVGQIFLMGDLSSDYSDSIGTQLHYTYGVSDLFGFNASVGYSEHSDGRLTMATLLTGMRTNLSWFDKVVPYLNFGLGFYRPNFTQTVGSASVSYSSVLFGVHLGPGIDLEVTRQLFFGAALTFNHVFGGTKSTPLGPKELGGTFTSFLLHAGVSF